MHTKKTSTFPVAVAIVVFIALFVSVVYTFLHEAGHALVGLLLGQSLTAFSINFWDLSAHVGLTGGAQTQTQLAVQSAAGVTLPFLIWIAFIYLVPRKSVWIIEVLKLIFSLAVVNTWLAWIGLPLVFISGNAPSDDVTNFLRYSGMNPWLLSLAAAALYGLGWWLFLSKIDGLRNAFRLLRTTDLQTLTAGLRKTLPVLAGTLGMLVVLAFLLNMSAAENPVDRLSPPGDFVRIAEIDLSTQAYSGEVLAQFSIEAAAEAGIFVLVKDINTPYFDLRVVGPDGYSSVVLHGEGYWTDRDGGLWEATLSPGTYQLVLTSHQSPGSVSVYMKPR